MNPAITYTDEMEKILTTKKHIENLTDKEKKRWLILHEKSHHECSIRIETEILHGGNYRMTQCIAYIVIGISNISLYIKMLIY